MITSIGNYILHKRNQLELNDRGNIKKDKPNKN